MSLTTEIVFRNNGLEIALRQIRTKVCTGSVELLDVSHSIVSNGVFNFVSKDFVKPRLYIGGYLWCITPSINF